MISCLKPKKVIFCLLFFFMLVPVLSFANEPTHQEGTTHVENEHRQNEGSDHHPDTSPLFFIIIAVIIGAATRFVFQKSVIPFTVILLLLGIGIGVLGRFNYLDIY